MPPSVLRDLSRRAFPFPVAFALLALTHCHAPSNVTERDGAPSACVPDSAAPVREVVPGMNTDAGATDHLPVWPRVLRDMGGPVQTNPRWVPVYFPNDAFLADTSRLLASLGCSSYWTSVTAEYGVGAATVGPATTVPEEPPSTLDDAEIRAWLTRKIVDGELEPATPDTTYVVFYPARVKVTMTPADHLPGASTVVMTSCESGRPGFAGYHWALRLPNGVTASYAVIPACGGFPARTASLSHELVESATNPDELRPAFGSGDAVVELTDLCGDLSTAAGLSRSFSNRASANGHDPCVPYDDGGSRHFAAELVTSESFPWNGLELPGVYVAPGAEVRLEVRLYADAPLEWSVAPSILLGSSTARLERASGRAGDRMGLILRTSPDAPPGSTELLVLHSVDGTIERDDAGAFAGAMGNFFTREFLVRH